MTRKVKILEDGNVEITWRISEYDSDDDDYYDCTDYSVPSRFLPELSLHFAAPMNMNLEKQLK